MKKNLTATFDLNKKFDLLISLEVAEHLPKESADIFVKSLTTHSDFILFSAAIPGQGGQYHVNEQWPNYWNEKFVDNGYEAFDILRSHFWNNENVFWWYKQNMVIYAKKGSLVCNEFEIEKHVKSLVHPDLYSKKTTKPKYLKNRKALIKLLLNTLKSFVK